MRERERERERESSSVMLVPLGGSWSGDDNTIFILNAFDACTAASGGWVGRGRIYILLSESPPQRSEKGAPTPKKGRRDSLLAVKCTEGVLRFTTAS